MTMTPTPACAEARAVLEAALSPRWADNDLLLRLCLENGVELEGGAAPEYLAAQHVQSCLACQAWLNLDARYPERQQRRERIARYCCHEMLTAVTDEKALFALCISKIGTLKGFGS